MTSEMEKREHINRLLREGKSNEQIAKITKESIESIRGYAAKFTQSKELKKLRKGGLLILECTPEALEGKQNEGAFLQELAKVLNPTISSRVIPVNNSADFLRILDQSTYAVIHISAHGKDFLSAHNSAGVKGTIIGFPEGDFVTAEQIKQKLLQKKPSERPKLMLMSACESGSAEMVRAVTEGKCRYFIAPLEKTSWIDASVFITLFYRLLFIERSTPWKSFDRTNKALKRLLHSYSGYWNFYDNGRLCYSSEGQKLGFKI